MPNWCENLLLLEFDNPAEHMKFLELFDDNTRSEYLFETFVPTPDNITNVERWRFDNWGVKWDTVKFRDVEYIPNDDNGCQLNFLTPNQPPRAFVQTLTRLFGVRATLRYNEPDMDIGGEITFYRDLLERDIKLPTTNEL